MIAPGGRATYEKVMPLARKCQASVLDVLTQQKRVVLYGALMTLRERCTSIGE